MIKEYDIAFSFAGEDRDFVRPIAIELTRHGVKVFYDELEQVNLWGKNLYQHLSQIYSFKADYCAIFISKFYVEKSWAKHELRSAQERAFAQDAEYILPIRLDNTKVPGISETTGYIDARKFSTKGLIDMFLKKLNYPSTAHKKAKKEKNNSDPELLFLQIRSIINSLDPIDLFPEAPSDEYDPEIRDIITILPEIKSISELTIKIHSIFVKWFDKKIVGSISDYEKVAYEIWCLTHEKMESVY
ncbi:toll/interleukin-1 receptor domain-containing protein [Heliorestis convoluta]|uniref:TIR domain-containing protein n=1 Tax=Heliorestis convoluta TaxID=356322 RepID=A0A5Q2N1S6_9FIRM|nr:TIR domain-containing protein [Heliorestis convoluta]QGG46310.1 TIR domain-containing protein [Heliorestis convoluta]